MQNVDMPRSWMIRRLRFFRFLFFSCLFGAVVALCFFGGLALCVCLALAVLFSALSDAVRLSLDYPLQQRPGDALRSSTPGADGQ